MPKFPELSASLGETLDLPVPLPNGQVKEYSVPPVDADTWIWLTANGDETDDDKSETALYRRVLSEAVYNQLRADKAGWEQLRRCGMTAYTWHLYGEDTALKVWEGGVPKPRSTSTTGGTTETPAEAPSTPSPASESGTTRPPRKTRTSPGKTSSTGGAS